MFCHFGHGQSCFLMLAHNHSVLGWPSPSWPFILPTKNAGFSSWGEKLQRPFGEQTLVGVFYLVGFKKKSIKCSRGSQATSLFRA